MDSLAPLMHSYQSDLWSLIWSDHLIWIIPRNEPKNNTYTGKKLIGWFIKRTGTPLDDGARIKNVFSCALYPYMGGFDARAGVNWLSRSLAESTHWRGPSRNYLLKRWMEIKGPSRMPLPSWHFSTSIHCHSYFPLIWRKLQSWSKVVETNEYHKFFANVLTYKQVKNILILKPSAIASSPNKLYGWRHVKTRRVDWGRGWEGPRNWGF